MTEAHAWRGTALIRSFLLILLLSGCGPFADTMPVLDWQSWGEQSGVLRVIWHLPCVGGCRPTFSAGQRLTMPQAERNDLHLLNFPKE